MTTQGPGTLWIVSTPIGHLGDLSKRAIETLGSVDVVACEDTRHTGRLLAHLGISASLLSLHDHNERRRIGPLLQRLRNGESVALVCDAGTPLVSDPGYRLVREAIDADLPVVPVPGPSAVLTALVASGIAPSPFTFAGFPPPKAGRRRRFFEKLAALDHTVVIFESPHRIERSLDDALSVFGDRPCALCRELTKLHEEVLRGTLGEVLAEVRRRGRLKGEIVLVVGERGRAG